MSTMKQLVVVSLAFLLATPALATSNTSTLSSDGLYNRMKTLRTRYPNQVSIATMHGRPAYFLKTTNLSQSESQSFKRDLLKTLGTNTVRVWNTTDWLQVGTGTGSGRSLSPQNKGRHFALYNTFRDYEWTLPCEGQTCVLIKLKNSQLKNTRGKGFDQYINAIRSNFTAALGATDYNGDSGGPPFVTDDSTSKHNCTSWFTNWAKHFVGGGLHYGADPGSWCMSTARGNATPVRGLLVFNHPDQPRDGQSLPSSFQLNWGDVH